jgi:hypothetical protein
MSETMHTEAQALPMTVRQASIAGVGKTPPRHLSGWCRVCGAGGCRCWGVDRLD